MSKFESVTVRFGRWHVLALSGAFACALTSLLITPLLTAIDPQLAAVVYQLRFSVEPELDPWGQPFTIQRADRVAILAGAMVSAGPNGEFEGGTGDDLRWNSGYVVDLSGKRVGVQFNSPMAQGVAVGADALLPVGVVILWFVGWSLLGPPRSRDGWREWGWVLWSGGLASAFAGGCVGWLTGVWGHRTRELVDVATEATPSVSVKPALALVVSLVGACFLAAAAVRLNTPLEDDAPEAEGAGDPLRDGGSAPTV